MSTKFVDQILWYQMISANYTWFYKVRGPYKILANFHKESWLNEWFQLRAS